MAILRHRSICALSALILAAVCALCVVSPGCALAAEVDAQADDANSWRFADGQLLTVPGLDGISLLSSESYTEFGIVRLRGNVVRGFQLHPCSFGPNDPVTREQLATLFARYASVVDGRDTSSDCSAMNSKNGADEVSDYAREAMGWAVDTGLIAGVNGTDLEPGGTAWRASMAEMVKRYSSF